MAGLIDIAPRTETVAVQGASVSVHGISAKGIAHLLGRFPELRKPMTGQEVEADELMAIGGDAVAAIKRPAAATLVMRTPRQSQASSRLMPRPICSPPSSA